MKNTHAQYCSTRNSDRVGEGWFLWDASASEHPSKYVSDYGEFFDFGAFGYFGMTNSAVVSYTVVLSVTAAKEGVAPLIDKSHLTTRLDEIGRLSQGWDQYGALAIDGGLIAKAKDLIPLIAEVATTAPRIVPLHEGTLQFEWRHNGKILELEIESADLVHYLKWHPKNAIKDEDVIPITDRTAISELIEWFCTDNS